MPTTEFTARASNRWSSFFQFHMLGIRRDRAVHGGRDILMPYRRS